MELWPPDTEMLQFINVGITSSGKCSLLVKVIFIRVRSQYQTPDHVPREHVL